VTLCRLNN